MRHEFSQVFCAMCNGSLHYRFTQLRHVYLEGILCSCLPPYSICSKLLFRTCKSRKRALFHGDDDDGGGADEGNGIALIASLHHSSSSRQIQNYKAAVENPFNAFKPRTGTFSYSFRDPTLQNMRHLRSSGRSL